MRNINSIIIHCAATKPTQDIGVAEIRKWHKLKGWKDIGYHYVIRRNGDLEDGRPNQQIGAHAKGFNKESIGICLVGGLDEDGKPDANFTDAQMNTLKNTTKFLMNQYNLSIADIFGHRDLPGVKKDCPCFNARHFIKTGKVAV
jgi:N-acetylmuramoyl-L-alanine amidase